MQYGSIGWSVGATLGYAQAAKEKRVLAFIGDGSFQVRKIVSTEFNTELAVLIYSIAFVSSCIANTCCR